MRLYGFRINETTASMQKKAYFCKVKNDIDHMAEKLNYYGAYYIKRPDIKDVIRHAGKDRNALYQKPLQYIMAELHSHEIYHYTEAHLLALCDNMSGEFVCSYLDLIAYCMDIVGHKQEEQSIRELRKQTRMRVGAIGSGFSGFATAVLKAGAINIATGTIHSAINVVGNVFSSIDQFMSFDALYSDDNTHRDLQRAMRNDCKMLVQGLAYILEFELGEEWSYPFSSSALNRADVIVSKIEGGQIPDADQKKLLVECIINYAPYHYPLYQRAAKLFGDSNEELLTVATYFSVSEYITQCTKAKARVKYQENTKSAPLTFFGDNYSEAVGYIEKNRALASVYLHLRAHLTTDYVEMLKILVNQKIFEDNGSGEGNVIKPKIRKRLIIFNLDFPSLIKQPEERKKYIRLCRASLQEREEAFAFVDTSYFHTKDKGFLITNRGFYFSEACNVAQKGTPLLYSNITAIKGEMLDCISIYYNQKKANVSTIPEAYINYLIFFTYVYFRYGQFDTI